MKKEDMTIGMTEVDGVPITCPKCESQLTWDGERLLHPGDERLCPADAPGFGEGGF